MNTTTVAPKIWTSLTAPGERAVKVNGVYVGLIVRTDAGWKWMGGPKTFPTFRMAAEYVASKTRDKWADA